jgi:phosphatidylglycerophosphate synthase
MGAFLDPLADKLLVTAALVSLVELGELSAWVAMVVIARELAVTGLRMVAAARSVVISASWWGKIKTGGQMAAIAALIVEPRAAVVAAVRWTDTLIPLLLAIPVSRFARSFAGVGHRGARVSAAVVLVGLLAVVSGSALGMAGGMIKNAAALPFSLLFAVYVHDWLRHGAGRTLGLAALCLAVSSLTHFGGLVLTASGGVLVFVAGLLTPGGRARVRLPALALPACVLGVVGLVRVVDADRAARLLHAVLHPGWLLADSPVSQWLQGDATALVHDVLTSEDVWLGNALGLIGLYALWRLRRDMDPATRVVVAGTTMTALCFSSPLLRPDVLERLAMMAYVPGMVPAVYLVCRTTWGSALVAPLTVLAMLNGALAVKTLRVTSLVRPAFVELEQLKAALPPGRNIVVTRPLLRWWVVWALDVDYSSRAGRALADRGAYDGVLVLDEIRPGAFGQAPSPVGDGAPGVGVRDAVLLRSEAVTTLAEGEYFRLSRVGPGHGPPAGGRAP